MSDSLACFPLRSASTVELGVCLARSVAEFNAWGGQASFIAHFVQIARSSNVKSVLATYVKSGFEEMITLGIAYSRTGESIQLDALAEQVAETKLNDVDVGAKIAGIVMLHSSMERLIWRMVRFGLVANRSEALKCIGKRKLTVDEIQSADVDACLDIQLEMWWDELNRDSLIQKWDRLVCLIGYPSHLMTRGRWHFDRTLLEQFDSVRHNAVHDEAKTVREFDFRGFSEQSQRAMMMWMVHICQKLAIKVPAETMWGLSKSPLTPLALR